MANTTIYSPEGPQRPKPLLIPVTREEFEISCIALSKVFYSTCQDHGPFGKSSLMGKPPVAPIVLEIAGDIRNGELNLANAKIQSSKDFKPVIKDEFDKKLTHLYMRYEEEKKKFSQGKEDNNTHTSTYKYNG